MEARARARQRGWTALGGGGGGVGGGDGEVLTARPRAGRRQRSGRAQSAEKMVWQVFKKCSNGEHNKLFEGRARQTEQ